MTDIIIREIINNVQTEFLFLLMETERATRPFRSYDEKDHLSFCKMIHMNVV